MVRDVLPKNVYREIEVMDKADVVIGIPSYNNKETIAHVVEAAALGLAKYFPGLKGVIINSDGGSTDGTPEVFMNANPFNRADYYFMDLECIPTRKISFAYKGIPGKGSAFRGIFEAAYLLKADLCIVVDSDLRSITPEWFEALGSPILDKGYDYVVPYYVRHKFDGTITNSISYPFTRALYGMDVRQPIGGDFGVAGTLLPNYLSRDVWETDVAKYGIDIWMTTTAIAQGYKVAQAFLGCKIHDAKDPGEHLGPMFRQVVSTLMKLAGEYAGVAGEVNEVNEVPVFGFRFAANPEPLPVDLGRLVTKFKTGFEENKSAIKDILSPEVFKEVELLTGMSADSFDFPAELWVKVVFDYTAKLVAEGVPEMVDTMIPLYYGRTAGFVKQTDGMSSDEAEVVIRNLADIYFKNRDYLVEKIRQKSGSRPTTGTEHIPVGRGNRSYKQLQAAPSSSCGESWFGGRSCVLEDIMEEKEGEDPIAKIKVQVLIFFVLFLFLYNCPLKKFVANRYSRKYHSCKCIYGMKIRQDNRLYVRTVRGAKELEKKGFRGCRLCKPLQDSGRNGSSKSKKTSSDEVRQPGEQY